MHIYVFGSLCRGDIDHGSDIDLLAIVDGFDKRFDPNTFSVYSYKRLKQLWDEGNPFSWHLAAESRLIYSSNDTNFIRSLGSPSEYKNCKGDCLKFYQLYKKAITSIHSESASHVFELSSIFLAIRNFATCYSLGLNKLGNFSRHSALHLGGDSLKISKETYEILERSRLLSIRGVGNFIENKEVEKAVSESSKITEWMDYLLEEVKKNG